MFAGVPCTTSFEVCQVASQAASIIQEGCVVHHAAAEPTGCWVGTVSKATLGSSACKLQSTQSSRCVPGPWMMRRGGPDDLRNILLVYRCCQLGKTQPIPRAAQASSCCSKVAESLEMSFARGFCRILQALKHACDLLLVWPTWLETIT